MPTLACVYKCSQRLDTVIAYITAITDIQYTHLLGAFNHIRRSGGIIAAQVRCNGFSNKAIVQLSMAQL